MPAVPGAPMLVGDVSHGGYEFVLLLGVASLAVALAGPGRLSADAALRLPARASSRLRSAPSR